MTTTHGGHPSQADAQLLFLLQTEPIMEISPHAINTRPGTSSPARKAPAWYFRYDRASLAIVLTISADICLAQSPQWRRSEHQHSVTADTEVGKAVVLADGAVNPSVIPDEVAFLHFFRLLAKDPHALNEQSDESRRVSYLRFFFTRNCGPSGQDDRSLSDSEETAVLEFAEKVGSGLAALVEGPGSSSLASALVSEAVMSAIRDLERQLGPEVARKVKSHVTDQMKPRIKIVQSRIPESGK